jgi:hypothetical protein
MSSFTQSSTQTFDMSQSTLHLLHQSMENERRSHTPQQKQFIQNIMKPIDYQSIQQNQNQTNHSQQRSNNNNTNASPSVSLDNSSFLIQDRISFYEHYPVVPKAVAIQGTNNSNQNQGLSKTQPILYSRGIPTHSRHVGNDSTADDSNKQYGSILGSPDGSYTDRTSALPSATSSKTLSGSGAPQRILQFNASSSRARQKKLLAERAGRTDLGFGSSRVKDTTTSIAPVVAENLRTARQQAGPVAALPTKTKKEEEFDKRVYPANIVTSPTTNPAFLTKTPRFKNNPIMSIYATEQFKIQSNQHKWGPAHTPDLPPFLDSQTAQSLANLLHSHQQVDNEYNDDNKNTISRQPVSDGRGGYLLDSVADSVALSNRTNKTPNPLQYYRSLSDESVGSIASGSISMSEHCTIVNAALAQKTNELLGIYKIKLQK